jgi:hypothetical protein
MERSKVEYLTPPESEIHVFDNKVQLDKYFAVHYDEFEGMSSHRLNQLFRLPGYKIVKHKRNIMLLIIRDEDIKPIDKIPIPDLFPEIDQIRTKIKQQDDLITLILNTLHEHNMLEL